MLRERNAMLIQNLNEVIKKYSRNSKFRDLVMDEFKIRNMKASNAINILNERIELSTLNIDENKDLILLFVFTVAIFKAITTLKETEETDIAVNLDEINPENYFTPIEVENLMDYKLEKEEVEERETHIFSNMIKVADGHWRGIISAKQLYQLDAGNDIVYNFKTQRDPVIDMFGMKRIRLDKTKVQTIKERLLSGQQFSDEIRINVLHDGEDEIYFNEKTGELTVISGTMNIFDGYHRKTANSLAVIENPDIEFNWGLAITNFSEKKAQDFMVQIDKQKPIKQEHTKAMDTSSLGNVVVDAIKDIDTSEFATQIRELNNELKFGGLVTKAILATAIEECYKDNLKNKLQVRPIAKHVANIMDYIIALHVQEFIANPEETKQISYINHKNMFAGYIALSEKLFGDKEWEDKIEKVMDNIDFSVDNSFWKDIGLTDTEMSKSTRKNLYKFFRNQL